MHSRIAPLALAVSCLGFAVCATAQTQPAPAKTPLPAATAPSADYDYYILALSWSPEFCVTNTSSECTSHPGFVIHGLWPERNDGSYPQHCATLPGPTSDSVTAGLMPTPALALHEWETHGTCTPYAADAYFTLVRKAFQSVKIPAEFTHTTQETTEPPSAIIESFARINTGFPAGGIVLSCGNNRLTAIELCFAKDLTPIACSGIRTCRANVVKITPQTGGAQTGAAQ